MKCTKLLYFLALAVAPVLCSAQQLALKSSAGSADSASSNASPAGIVSLTKATKPAKKKPLTSRWLDLKTFSHSERYRNEYNFGDAHLFEGGQERSLIAGRVKLDKADRYSVGFRISTGHYFNWAYSDFAGKTEASRVNGGDLGNSFLGTPFQAERKLAVAADPAGKVLLSNPSTGWGLYFREFYVSARPIKVLSVEFGSFGIERGSATEATTFDDDGYLDGERVVLHDPAHLFFDNIGFTSAFFGNVDTPSMFDRGDAFTQSNYRQLFANKQLNDRIDFSAEYNWLNKTDTLREAAFVKTPETRIVDGVRFEMYQRLNTVNLQGLNVGGGSGFAVTLDKALTPRLSGDVGYADIDKDYSVYFDSRFFHAVGFALNGDQYGLGKRPFVHASYKVNPVVTAYGFYTHEIGQTIVSLNKQGLNVGLNLNLKALVNTSANVF